MRKHTKYMHVPPLIQASHIYQNPSDQKLLGLHVWGIMPSNANSTSCGLLAKAIPQWYMVESLSDRVTGK